MSQTKALLVINPTAAKGRTGTRVAEIQGALRRRGLDFETRITRGVGHATELARSAGGEGFTSIIAAGGDGTMNEVINGLMEAKAGGGGPPILGVLPLGSGNDFSCGMGLVEELETAADLIAGGNRGRLDLGFVSGGDYPGGRWFGNGVGIGFDALVGFAAARFRRIRGPLRYTLGALQIFALFPDPPRVLIESDTFSYEGRCQQVSLMNGRRMGGSYYMAPEAVIDDGLLDICVVGDVTRLELAALIIRYTKGSQKGRPKVSMGRGQRFHVVAPEGGLAVHADGETICERGKEVTVECQAGALEAFMPPRP
jgi:YegS/Rv2252/BmrU family lipid kinase